MKQKIITITLILISLLVPLLILPIIVADSTYILKLWTLYICGAVLFVSLIINYKTIKTDKKDILLYIFLGLVFISTCLSTNIKISIFGFTYRYEGLLMFLIYGCIYLCTKKFFKIDNYKKIMNLLFYVYLIIGILGILERYIGFWILYPIFAKGISSTFGNPNFFGSFISLILPISICIHMINGSKKAFILSIVMTFNLISCSTRSAWLATFFVIIAIIIYIIKNKKKENIKRFFIFFTCFIIIGITVFFGFDFKIRNLISGIDGNNYSDTDKKRQQIKLEFSMLDKEKGFEKAGSSRIEIWKYTMQVIEKKPIFGCGVDNLNDGLDKYADGWTKYIDKAHNEYLQIASTIGIPSLLVYLTFLAMILIPKLKNIFKDKATFIIALAICSYLAQAFFNISVIAVAPLFWMLLGLIDNKEMIEIFNTSMENEEGEHR